MIHMIGMDKETDAVETVLTNRYEYFVSLIGQLYTHLCSNKKGDKLVKDVAFNMRDDVIQRLAFTFAMAPKGLRTRADRANFLEDCRNKTTDKYKIWTPVLYKLRPIYFHEEWGWDSFIHDTDESWRIELKHHSHSPRPIFFPAKSYRDSYQETEANKRDLEAQAMTEQPIQTPERQAESALCDETGVKILSELKNRLDEKRYDFGFGNAGCLFDDRRKIVLFIVKNNFDAKNTRGFSEEIASVIAAVLGSDVTHQVILPGDFERLQQSQENARRMREEHEAADKKWKQELLTH